ncbi:MULTISPECIES: DUF5701 family protein [unclassified Streptomyces]|uniref:DUF5701 family protein n=1 Tax=Streptomyces sp. Ag109_G2-15 TaxID=1938850 RepID=UPI001C6DEC5E
MLGRYVVPLTASRLGLPSRRRRPTRHPRRRRRRDGKPGLDAGDAYDVSLFAPFDTVASPGAPLYLLSGLDRSDRSATWRPSVEQPYRSSAGRRFMPRGAGRGSRGRR